MCLALWFRTAVHNFGLITAFAGIRVDHAGWTHGLGVETVRYLGGGGQLAGALVRDTRFTALRLAFVGVRFAVFATDRLVNFDTRAA